MVKLRATSTGSDCNQPASHVHGNPSVLVQKPLHVQGMTEQISGMKAVKFCITNVSLVVDKSASVLLSIALTA